MIGALFLSATNAEREKKCGETGLYRAFRWLDAIKCVPLKTSGILKNVKQFKESTLNLKIPLWKLKFSEFDKIKDVYAKYFAVIPEYEDPIASHYAHQRIKAFFADEIGELGCKMGHLNSLKAEFFMDGALKEL